MKICVISNLYKPHTRGGAEKIVDIQTRGLIDHGHDVIIISTKPTFGLEIEENEKNKIYRFKPLNLFYYLNDYKFNPVIRFFWHIIDTFNLYSAFEVLRILMKEKPELVITHNLKGIGFLIPLIIKMLRKKHYHVLHDVQLAIPSGLIIKNQENSFLNIGFPTKIYQFVTKILFGSPDKVIYPSSWLENFYTSYSFFRKSQKQLLRNPILKLETYISVKTKKSNTYGYLGQLGSYKGVKWLLDVWVEKKIKADLKIAGKGDFNISEFKKYKNIDILGFLNSENVEAFFQTIDFLIVPSLCYENSPTVILEAFQYATPVIVADIGGTAELVDMNENGYVFEALNDFSFITELTNALNLTNREYEQFSKNSLESAQKLSMDEYIQRLIEPNSSVE